MSLSPFVSSRCIEKWHEGGGRSEYRGEGDISSSSRVWIGAERMDGDPSISREEALKLVPKLAQEAARNWVDSLSDEEAAELVEKHDLAGGAHHLRKLTILKYRKAMRLAGNTKAVDEANQILNWFEDNRY